MPELKGRLRIRSLPGFGLGTFPEWYENASCQDKPREWFFPAEDFGRGRPPPDLWSKGKQVCRQCPVRAACLDLALKHREAFGLWGGLTPTERKERNRGR